MHRRGEISYRSGERQETLGRAWVPTLQAGEGSRERRCATRAGRAANVLVTERAV